MKISEMHKFAVINRKKGNFCRALEFFNFDLDEFLKQVDWKNGLLGFFYPKILLNIYGF